ncbi:alpha/beta hydrolase fold protein [Mycobacterium tuberculosis]|nr:alpha/beta hydrolase fold protein [Mycobacterium tuberculosis]
MSERLMKFHGGAGVLAAEVREPEASRGLVVLLHGGGQTRRRDPEITERLVLVDITPRPSVAGVERVKAFMTAHPAGFASLEDVAAAVAAYSPHRRTANPEGLRRNVRLGEDGRWHWHWDPAILPEGNEVDDPIVRPEDSVAAASRITVPTLLIAGGLSEVVSAGEIGEFREVMPNAQVVTVDGAGHVVAGDRNDPFVDSIRAFLED